MRFLKGFGKFWYDFIIGDDWKIAVGVVVALAVTLGLLLAGLPDGVVTVVGAVAVFTAFTVVLAIDQRPRPKR
jgi:hypothetical protein